MDNFCKFVTNFLKKEALYFSTVWDTCSTLYLEYSELKIDLLEYQKILPYIKYNVLRIYQYPHPLPPNMLVRYLIGPCNKQNAQSYIYESRGVFRISLRGGRDFAREARAIFFAPLSNFRPPLSASQGGGQKLLRGGGGLIITNRHNTVMKSFKFGHKVLGVLDSFFFQTRKRAWKEDDSFVTFLGLLGPLQMPWPGRRQMIQN